MQKTSAMSAAFSVFLLAPLLAVNAARAEAGIDIAGDVHLGFRVGEADVDVFYDALAPYGDWVDTGRYGLCWAPRGVEDHWRPYRYGHWVYTDYEWTWVGDEEWGWGPYHYGRWAFDPAYGWVWVPGSVWAPAWVVWRWGDGYAGWAPLPPEADPSAGPADFGIDPLAFNFVEVRFLTEPVLVSRYVPPARNVTIIDVTKNVTNYRVVDNRVVNHGVPVDAVERATGHAVPRLRVTENAAPAATRARGNEVAVFRPHVREAPATPSHTRAATRRSLASPPPAPSELKRRQDQEREHLQAAEAKERDELRRLHEQEKATPPANVSTRQLEERHRAEERAQAEHEQRQKQMLEERQARERKAAEEAAKQRQQQQRATKEKDKKKPEKTEQPG